MKLRKGHKKEDGNISRRSAVACPECLNRPGLEWDADEYDEVVEWIYATRIVNLRSQCREISTDIDADDAIQDFMTDKFPNLVKKYNPDGDLLGYLFISFQNHCKGRRKREARRSAFETESLDSDAGELMNVPGLEPEQRNLVNRELVEIALGKLEEKYALVVQLHYFGDPSKSPGKTSPLSIEEIAELTGLTKACIKVRLMRGRKKLREIISRLSRPLPQGLPN